MKMEQGGRDPDLQIFLRGRSCDALTASVTVTSLGFKVRQAHMSPECRGIDCVLTGQLIPALRLESGQGFRRILNENGLERYLES